MTVFADIANKIRRMPIQSIIMNSIEDHKEQISELNKDQQHLGLTPTGEIIGLLSSPNSGYAKRKKNKGGQAPIGVADLHNTGKYHRGFKTTIKGTNIVTRSSDKTKEKKIMERFGKDKDRYYGLSKENIEKFNRLYLKPEVKKRIKAFINV